MTEPAGDEEADAAALMAQASDAIIAGVERLAGEWVVGAVTRIVDAWGGLPAPARASTIEEARAIAGTASARVVGELREFFATDPARQRTTPLAIVRTLRYEPTTVLAHAGIPGVERDEFDTRAFPDDVYGLVPQSLADLGDDDLAPMLMVWGVGKAKVLRRRSTGSAPSEP